jgi:hypothetical protein
MPSSLMFGLVLTAWAVTPDGEVCGERVMNQLSGGWTPPVVAAQWLKGSSGGWAYTKAAEEKCL